MSDDSNWGSVSGLKLSKVDGELTCRITLHPTDRDVEVAGATMGAALMRAFSVAGIYRASSEHDLAAKLFWHFDGGHYWLAARQALAGKDWEGWFAKEGVTF